MGKRGKTAIPLAPAKNSGGLTREKVLVRKMSRGRGNSARPVDMSLDAEIDKDGKLPPLLLSHRRRPWANMARRFDQIGGTRTTLALSRHALSRRHALDH